MSKPAHFQGTSFSPAEPYSAGQVQAAKSAWTNYLSKKEPDPEVKPITVFGYSGFTFISQEWHGTVWHHTLAVVYPKVWNRSVRESGIGGFLITGGRANPTDLRDVQQIAEGAQMPVAVLFDVPNEPLFGLQEDYLLADTLEKCLNSGDSTWPLQMPMVKAVFASFSILNEYSFKKVILFGESKRAWTAWLAAVTAPLAPSPSLSIIGLAPMAFDNLNFPAQMKMQRQEWGGYSPALKPYTELHLEDITENSKGASLAALVDPIATITGLNFPVLIARGTNDPFWTLDAFNQYRSKMPNDTSLRFLPNQAHDWTDKPPLWKSLSGFMRQCAGIQTPSHISLSRLQTSKPTHGRRFEVSWTGPATGVKVWNAFGKGMHFEQSTWNVARTFPANPDHRQTFTLAVKNGETAACFVSIQFKGENGPDFELTSPVEVVH